MGDAAAIGTKVKGDAGFAPRTGGSDIRACGTGKLGPVTHKVISPQHAIAAADGAVAGGGAFRRHVEFPADRAAMTAAFDHAFTLVQFGCGPSLGSSDNADFAGDKLPFSSSLFRAAFIVGEKISAGAAIPVHRPIDRRFGAAIGIFGRLKKEFSLPHNKGPDQAARPLAQLCPTRSNRNPRHKISKTWADHLVYRDCHGPPRQSPHNHSRRRGKGCCFAPPRQGEHLIWSALGLHRLQEMELTIKERAFS